MFDLKAFNEFMTIIATTQPAPLSQPSINLRGKQICMSGFITSQRQLAKKNINKLQYQ